MNLSVNNLYLYGVSLYLIFAITYQQHLIEVIYGVREIVSGVLMVLVGLVLVICTFIRLKFNILMVLYMFLAVIVAASSLLIHHKFFPGAYFSIIVTLSLCQILSRKYTNGLYILLSPFYLYFIFIVFRMFTVTINPDGIFLNSGNWISYYLILLVIPYYFVSFSSKQEASMIPSYIIFILSVYSHSRSGMLSSMLMLAAVYMYSGVNFGRLLLLMSIFVFAVFIFQLNDFDARMARFDSISNLVSEGGRAQIIAGVFSSFDVLNYLFGFDIGSIDSDYEITTNLHNSYLNLFVTSGVVIGGAFIIIFLSSFVVIGFKSISMLLLLMAPAVRVATDAGALYGFFDVSIMLTVYYAFSHVRVGVNDNIKINSQKMLSGLQLHSRV
jgi:hypothetical protein